jgi:hypothetical protein
MVSGSGTSSITSQREYGYFSWLSATCGLDDSAMAPSNGYGEGLLTAGDLQNNREKEYFYSLLTQP